MPPRNDNHRGGGFVRGFALLAIAGVLSPLSAQELTLLRDYPGSGAYQCAAPATYAQPEPDELLQAGQLASDAGQAVVLGDFLRAEELLSRATQLDPTSADYAYRRARVLEDQGQSAGAMAEYCRAIALGAVDIGILDSRDRIDTLNEVVRAQIPEAARQGFVAGLLEADARLYPEAVESFTLAIDAAPDWAEAVFNRAVVLEEMGLVQESLVDYRLYLALTPSEVDPLVVLVSERIGQLEGLVSLPTPNPGGALTLGVLFPGMGHYYTGRSLWGTMILSVAGGAAAAGFMVKDVTVRCLNPVVPGQDCPPNEIVDETTERPFLIPALGAAAAVTLIGAVEAFVRARGRRTEQATFGNPGGDDFGFTGPRVIPRGDRVDVSLLGLRFR